MDCRLRCHAGGVKPLWASPPHALRVIARNEAIQKDPSLSSLRVIARNEAIQIKDPYPRLLRRPSSQIEDSTMQSESMTRSGSQAQSDA